MIKTAVVVNQGGLSTQIDFDNYESDNLFISFYKGTEWQGMVNLEDVSFIKIVEAEVETVH